MRCYDQLMRTSPDTSDRTGSPTLQGGQTDSRRPSRQPSRWLRIGLPVVLTLLWLVLGGLGGPTFGKISQVASTDATTFLPASSQSTQVQQWQQRFADDPDVIPAVVVFTTEDNRELTAGDLQQITDRVAAAADGATASPVIPSEDRQAAQVVIELDRGDGPKAPVQQLQQALADPDPASTDIEAHVTGPAGYAADLSAAFAGIDGVLLIVALSAVLVILVLVYRSLLLPLLVLLTSVFALCASILTVFWLAKAGVVQLNGQSQGILCILVIGACTDYSLLIVHRYRELLTTEPSVWRAVLAALRANLEPVAASAGTVIAGLLCLLLSDLNSNRSLGPVTAIGIVWAFLAAMTLLPALLALVGRAGFWPNVPRLRAAHVSNERTGRLWPAVARFVDRRHRTVWIASVVLLAAGATGLFGLNANGVQQRDLVLTENQSSTGQALLEQHFAGGTGSPVTVIADTTDAAAALDTLRAADGMSGAYQVTDGPSGAPIPGAQPLEVDGHVQLRATLEHGADDPSSEQAVRELRADLATAAPSALVGGVTATAVDTNDAAMHDRNLIIPVVLVVITIILMLLLRSIVAPIMLLGATVLSFAAALGVSSLIFDHVLHLPGADPSVPLYGFVFLVALGVDYNIFLMTRVREETRFFAENGVPDADLTRRQQHDAHLSTRRGIDEGLVQTGSVITSAGVVLAATFAALGVIPILFLLQLAIIVSFGVLLDTILVRSLLVPALAISMRRVLWWPSRLDRAGSSKRGA